MRSKSKTKKADSRDAIVIRSVRKEFVIPHERRTTLFENLLGVLRPATYEKFVALKDISLVIKKGESIGIIGDNGSGKSTLLKIIAQILRPTSGSIEVHGRITPFLELGVGFQPDLTARENIEVYSTIMGLSSKEIAANMDSVLEFAGLTKFKDTKLKNFSSGMYVRLAFATAIQTKPEILLVDEVLAVGDMDFQQKCLDIFQKYKEDGITLIFVSHDLNSVRKFCDKALLLKNGEQVVYGNTNDVIDNYIYGGKSELGPEPLSIAETPAGASSGTAQPDPANQLEKPSTRWGNKKVSITDVRFIDKFGGLNTAFVSGDPMTIRIIYDVTEETDDIVFGIALYNESGQHYYGTNTDLKHFAVGKVSGRKEIDLIVDRIPMLQGKYYLTVAAHSKNHEPYDWHDKLYSFNIHNPTHDVGLFDLPCRWVDN